jgi:HD-GYP domain-containing protein (c-di-GMP phosphodiesterase class II)
VPELLYRYEHGHADVVVAQLTPAFFREHNLEPQKVTEADQEPVIANLVMSGVGLSLVREEVALRTIQLEQEKGALRAMTISVAETLINAMEAKDLYLRGHSQRVAEIAAALAVHLELDATTVASIHTAGRLHDVGKIGIREEILNKPGPLTLDEFAHVKDHVRIGLEILSPLNHLGEALLFIRDHHEHWDGGGYPFGRAADDITIGGRILTAADAFDALTSKRAYREPMTGAATLEYLRTQSGRLLEPRIYDALLAVVQSGIVEGIPRVK